MTTPLAFALGLIALLAGTAAILGWRYPTTPARVQPGCQLEHLMGPATTPQPEPDLFTPKTAPSPEEWNPPLWKAQRMAWDAYRRDAMARAHRMANQPWGDQCE